MNQNIYKTPEVGFNLEEEEENTDQLASTGQRLLTLILDYVGFYCFAFCIGLTLGFLGLQGILMDINDTVLGLLIMIVYYTTQEALFGRTLGKLITGTKAVDLEGNNLTFMKALSRTLCRFIPFEAFSFLGGNGRPKGWHDRISKTKVISLR